MTDEPEETAPASIAPVKVKNMIDGEKLKEDLTYSILNLSDAMTNQASLFAYYASLAAQAARQVDDIDMMLDIAKARVARKVRDDAINSTPPQKLTGAEVEALVLSHPKIISVRQAYNAAKQIEATAKTATEAFRHRKDMLIQLGAHEREELKGELRLSARRVVEEDIKERQARTLRALAEAKEKV